MRLCYGDCQVREGRIGFSRSWVLSGLGSTVWFCLGHEDSAPGSTCYPHLTAIGQCIMIYACFHRAEPERAQSTDRGNDSPPPRAATGTCHCQTDCRCFVQLLLAPLTA